jgi:hypothetical protein
MHPAQWLSVFGSTFFSVPFALQELQVLGIFAASVSAMHAEHL